jgi:hypothetical protein
MGFTVAGGTPPRAGADGLYPSAKRRLSRTSLVYGSYVRTTRMVLLATLIAVSAVGAVTAAATRSTSIGCGSAIYELPTGSAANIRLVLDRIWLPKVSTVLSWRGAPSQAGADRFLKWGIRVDAGTPVTLEVPASSRRVYALYYGTSATSVADGPTAVRVTPCPLAYGRWTVWAGGYLVAKPSCVPLIVRVGSRSTRVSLSLGRRCA